MFSCKIPFRLTILLFPLLLSSACLQPLPRPEPVRDLSDISLPHPRVETIVDNLLGPVGLALLPDGSLLIAEEGSGDRDTSAGVTLVTADGRSGRLISGLFSTRDAGDLAGVPLIRVSPDGTVIYAANFGQDHLWTLPLAAFTDDNGTVHVPDHPFQPDDLGRAMPPLNNVRLTNPFDMTFDAAGNPIVSDASQNGVATTNPDGSTRFFHRFDRIPNPVRSTQPVEAVPTGITRVGDEYFITLFGGCPYPRGSGQVVAIDTQRNQRTILDGLNLPIDIAMGPDGTLWLLEFAQFTPGASCFDGSGYKPGSGRLSTISLDGTRQTILDNLDYPGAVLPAPDGSLYISQVFTGRVIRIVFESPKLAQAHSPTNHASPVPSPQSPVPSPQPPTPNPQSPTPSPQFINVAHESGLAFTHGAFQRGISMDPVAAMGGGLCWIDYDRDGWLDLYLVNSHSLDEVEDWKNAGGLPHNALFRNREGHFEDVSRETGTDIALRGNGCVAADFNLDGWTDLYVTAHGPNTLLWNGGDGRFSEGAAAAGIDAPEWNSAVSVGDLNGDGWPDLFVAGYIDLDNMIPKPTGHFPQDFFGIPDRLYLNLGVDPLTGRASFREITHEVGLTREERALGSLLSDLDRDGDLDLYIANDGHPNRLYANQPIFDDSAGLGFRFIDLTESADIGDSGSGMGVTGGDYDGDGQLDLFITNWDTELNALYRNLIAEKSLLTFQYSTYRIGISGLGNNQTGWGAHLMDVDHDTDLDIITVNGHVPITDFSTDAQLIRYYRNRSNSMAGKSERPGQFLDWTKQAGMDQIGPLMARGSAAADYDNDGDLDIAINNIGGEPVLLQNQVAEGNWLIIEPGKSAPGLHITLTLPDNRQLVRESFSGSSYLASEDHRLHFGLGPVELVPRLEIRWPGGRTQVITNIKANQKIIVAPKLE